LPAVELVSKASYHSDIRHGKKKNGVGEAYKMEALMRDAVMIARPAAVWNVTALHLNTSSTLIAALKTRSDIMEKAPRKR
jgi:hypothetical protein